MLNNIRADLRRYVKSRRDCKNVVLYLCQFLPIVFFHEGAIALIGYRAARWFHIMGLPLISYIISKIFFFVTGNYIHHKTLIGPGCKINHSAVVIHATEIGENFECSANITIGQKVPYVSPYPKIGNEVMVGAGARVLDNIGNNVIVGANSVVTRKFGSDVVIAGVPAKIVGHSQNHMECYRKYL